MPKSKVIIRVFILFIITLGARTSLFSQDYQLNGDAQFLGDDCFQLTTNQNTQLGSVWFEEQIDLSEPFTMQFTVYLGASNAGADGIVWVMQNNDTDILGEGGGSIGYATIPNSVGIEFDTWQNSDQGDPFNDHIGIVSDGLVTHVGASALSPAVQASSTSTNIEDNQDHVVEIIWDPETTELSVYFDCVFRTSSTTDLINEIFDGDPLVYWGFVGSTGGANNIQQFCVYQPTSSVDLEVAICDEGSVVLDVGGNPDADYSWSPSEGLSSDTAPNPIATPETTTTYEVQYSDFCEDSISATVTVFVEDLMLAIEGPTEINCLDTQAPLTVVSNPLFDLDYQWSTDDGVMIGDYNSPNVTALTDGIYTITVNQGMACEGTFDFEVIVNDEAYELIVEEPDPIDCYGGNITLESSIDGSGAVINWETSDGNIVSGENTLNPVVSSTGTYTITVFNPENECESEADVIVLGDTTPPTVFAGESDTVSCEEPTLVIMGVTTDAFSLEAQWSTSDGSILSGVNSLSPLIGDPGTYTLTITNLENGCVGSDNVEIFVSEDGLLDLTQLELPNIFTPNDDEFNQSYVPYLINEPELDFISLLKEFELHVFNRWGNEVYTWNSVDNPWEGENNNGNELGEGTYYIVFEYTIDCGKEESGSVAGYVQLVR